MALIIPKITEAAKNKEKELKELFVAHDSDQSGNLPYTILRFLFTASFGFITNI